MDQRLAVGRHIGHARARFSREDLIEVDVHQAIARPRAGARNLVQRRDVGVAVDIHWHAWKNSRNFRWCPSIRGNKRGA